MTDKLQQSILDNAIKLKSSSIVAALLTEEEKIMIFEKVAKMFLGRMEEFHEMTSKERDEALQDAARNIAHEEQQIAEGTYRPFDNMDLRIDFSKSYFASLREKLEWLYRLNRCW